jgi:hypothetical protein
VKVTAKTTRCEIEEAIGHLNDNAKKCHQVIGTEKWESPWDKAHRQINDLLDHLIHPDAPKRVVVDKHGGEYELTLLDLLEGTND